MSLKFQADDEQLRPMGRQTAGVQGMKFRNDDSLLAMKTQKEITEKTENLIEHLDEIDEQISAHTNAWNLERLGKAELSILRLATYEILLDEQVPRKVAINEAVELAKKYCNEKAAPFINGVLSKIGQDMDEE